MDLADPTTLPDPYEIQPFAGPIDAVVRPPGSKSITNRALLCAAFARGTTELSGVLWSDDTEAMVAALRTLGIDIEGAPGDDQVVVHGGGGELAPGPRALDGRLSGTTTRFVASALALGRGTYHLDASPAMRARPLDATFDALTQLGASVAPVGADPLPAAITPPREPRGPARLRMAGDATSQSLSGALLVGPCLPGGLVIELTTPLVSRPYVELTLAVMRAFGAEVNEEPGARYVVAPGGYAGSSTGKYDIEPDATAASYLWSAAALTRGRVVVEGLGSSSLQGDVGFADVLGAMGATVEREGGSTAVSLGGDLAGIEVDIGSMSDTAQTLAVVAVHATGPTRMDGIGFIRRKETDRIGAVVAELGRLGITAHEHDDGFTVEPGTPRPGVVRTYDDHRMAMSFALLGLVSPGIEIADPGCVAKTFPEYFAVLESLRPPGRLTAR